MNFIRAHELWAKYPVLSKWSWKRALMSGDLPSRKVGRARVVRVDDVEAFLSPSTTKAAA